MARWRVDFKGKRLQHVGTIKATTAEDAINEVAKLFRIEPNVTRQARGNKMPRTAGRRGRSLRRLTPPSCRNWPTI